MIVACSVACKFTRSTEKSKGAKSILIEVNSIVREKKRRERERERGGGGGGGLFALSNDKKVTCRPEHRPDVVLSSSAW